MAIPTADLTGSINPEWQVVARCIKNSSEESVQATEKTLNAPATNRQETSKKNPPEKVCQEKVWRQSTGRCRPAIQVDGARRT